VAQPVYSRRLWGDHVPNGTVEIYVPEGKLWIVRDMDAYANVSSTGQVDLYVIDRLSGATVWWTKYIETQQETRQWRGRQVFHYSQGQGGIIIQNIGSHAVDLFMSGYELSDPSALPAP